MKETKHLNLKLPDETDRYNVIDFNDNFTLIDQACEFNTVTHVQLEKLIKQITLCTLPTTEWKNKGAIFIQEIKVDGMLSIFNPVLIKTLSGSESPSDVKTYCKAFNLIFAGETAAGKVIFYAYKKPERDIVVGLKGV